MNYPNIRELVRWNYYGVPAMADHAGVTTDLFYAALNGEEELTEEELKGLAGLVDIPVSVLKMPYKIKLDSNKFQHIMKVLDLEEYFEFAKVLRTSQGQGSHLDLRDAEIYLNMYLQHFKDGNGSYCGYKAVLHKIRWNMQLYQMDLKQPRGLKKSN